MRSKLVKLAFSTVLFIAANSSSASFPEIGIDESRLSCVEKLSSKQTANEIASSNVELLLPKSLGGSDVLQTLRALVKELESSESQIENFRYLEKWIVSGKRDKSAAAYLLQSRPQFEHSQFKIMLDTLRNTSPSSSEFDAEVAMWLFEVAAAGQYCKPCRSEARKLLSSLPSDSERRLEANVLDVFAEFDPRLLATKAGEFLQWAEVLDRACVAGSGSSAYLLGELVATQVPYRSGLEETVKRLFLVAENLGYAKASQYIARIGLEPMSEEARKEMMLRRFSLGAVRGSADAQYTIANLSLQEDDLSDEDLDLILRLLERAAHGGSAGAALVYSRVMRTKGYSDFLADHWLSRAAALGSKGALIEIQERIKGPSEEVSRESRKIGAGK